MLYRRFMPLLAFVSIALLSMDAGAQCWLGYRRTIGQEIDAMDVVAIASLVQSPPLPKAGDDKEKVVKSKFRIEQVFKGKSLVPRNRIVEVVYPGDPKKSQQFLIMGRKQQWSTPQGLTMRGSDYISQIMELPKEGTDRLIFFQKYLEDKEEFLARDACDEFARAPYKTLRAIKPHMNRDQLVDWIKSPDVAAERRRLYFTMLGICGSKDDLPMLQALIKSDNRKDKIGMDALIACYLTLKGPSGMPLVEDLFLKNKEAEYEYTYAAIMALRFHVDEPGVIPRERILQAMRLMLERPKLADIVIPDLARWKDWSVVEKLFKLYKQADKRTSWVRVPIVNYMRSCPLVEAKRYLKEFERIDPEAVKRAITFFPKAPE